MFPLKSPSPDFQALKGVLMGDATPEKVHLVELLIDFEVMNFLAEKLMRRKISSHYRVREEREKRFRGGKARAHH